MSGEGAGYLLALPIAIGAVAVAGAGLAAYGVAKAGVFVGKSAYSYYRKKEEERQAIVESGVRSQLGTLHADVEATFAAMNQQGQQLYQEMEKEMAAQNRQMQEVLERMDLEEYQHYLSDMKKTQKEIYQKMETMHRKFDQEYAQKAEADLKEVQRNVNKNAQEVLEQIKEFQGSAQKKEAFAQDLAQKYIRQTRELLEALAGGFGDSYLKAAVQNTLERQLKDAVDMYNLQNYEGAIATAQTLQMNIGEKMYELEKEDIDWSVSYQAALTAADMVKEYLESQSSFSDEAAEEMKKMTGVEIPEELYDEEIADYADREADGTNRYLKILKAVQNIRKELDSDTVRERSSQELRKLTEQIYTVLYPQSMQIVQDAVMNMSNVFYRVEKANEFEDYLKSKDLQVRLFFEDEDDLTSDIGIAVYNDITGEKVVYTLAKQKNGENPQKVNIVYQLAQGDEQNESRNRYYQDLIKDFTGAQQMACTHGTVGKTASNLTQKAKEQLQTFTL